jgi:hypothetical protein
VCWICLKAKAALFLAPSARQGQERWVYMGFRESSGERIEGWLVRALNNDRIIGIAASSPSLEELAAYPEKLKGLLAVTNQ